MDPALAPARTEFTPLDGAILAHRCWIRLLGTGEPRRFCETSCWCGHYLGEANLLSNEVLLLRPIADAASWMAELEGMCPPSAACFVLSPWPTPDLTAFGFELVGQLPLMLRRAGPLDAPRGDVEVREVRASRELADVETILVSGLPVDLQAIEPGQLFPSTVLGSEANYWVAYAAGQAVSAAGVCTAGGTAMVEFLVTAPGSTGRGYGSLLASAAVSALSPYPVFVLASEYAYGLYRRLGFVSVERWTAWARAADGPSDWPCQPLAESAHLG